jgi:hypothetical protein
VGTYGSRRLNDGGRARRRPRHTRRRDCCGRRPDAGGIVTDLKKEDFKIIEDGQPQTITALTFVHIPVEQLRRPLGAPAPIEPDVKDNERPFDGRRT